MANDIWVDGVREVHASCVFRLISSFPFLETTIALEACHRALHPACLNSTCFFVAQTGKTLTGSLHTLLGRGLVPAARQPGSKQPPWKFVVVLLVRVPR